MAKKRVKVFESGNYPQGEFSETRTRKAFETAGEIPAIYIHSSKWEGKSPVELGKFNNFSFQKEGDQLSVFADVELNTKGETYHADGIFNGISVEIDQTNDSLSKIALLPLGVEPAIATAEFQAEDKKVVYTGKYQEFEEEGGTKTVTIDKIIEAIKGLPLGDRATVINALTATVSDEERKGMRKLLEWEKIDVIQSAPENELTIEEIREQVKNEMEFEAKKKALIELSKKKVIPVLQPAIEFAIEKAAAERTTIIEFSGTEKISQFEKFEKEFGAMKDAANFESEMKKMEFETENGEKNQDDNEKRIGGYYE